mgnify:CR=1 FL=1
MKEAMNMVSHEGFLMKRALDGNNLMDALKFSSNMVCELRTSSLTPQNYYALYVRAFDELRYLEAYFWEQKKSGQKVAEMYELVQHAGNILPRLYLLITVGSVYIRSKEAGAKDVLRDLVEMCKGLQHPIRGLFLRNYLSQLSKDKLPDVGNEYEGVGGQVDDSIEFCLINFVEMNKLWVRMQHQGAVKDREKREKERMDLRILVGTNLVRLSQLEGVDVEIYVNVVLPRILEQVVSCKDEIAQQYLMDCVIQVFPDEFHLRTLELFLSICNQLQHGVDIRLILVSLMDRLALFASTHPEGIPATINVFQIFLESVTSIIAREVSLALVDRLSLLESLLSLCLKLYPARLDYVDSVLALTHSQLKEPLSSASCIKNLKLIMSNIITSYRSLPIILSLPHYTLLFEGFPVTRRRTISLELCELILETKTCVESLEKGELLLNLFACMLKDTPEMEEFDDEYFADEQNAVARLFHLFRTDDPVVWFKLLLLLKSRIAGCGSARAKYNTPSLVFSALKLAETLEEDSQVLSPKKVFQFCHQLLVNAEYMSSQPAQALRLFLQCAVAAINLGLEGISYEFLTQAFTVYEEGYSESKSQYEAVTLLIGTLQMIAGFDAENYETLITKTAQHANKLLKKSDQCRAVAACSHLFWDNEEEDGYRDEKRVLECLQRALKLADATMDQNLKVQLFVEILNKYLFYFEAGNEMVQARYINKLVELINTNMGSLTANNVQTSELATFYQNTLKHVRSRVSSNPGGRYKGIDV